MSFERAISRMILYFPNTLDGVTATGVLPLHSNSKDSYYERIARSDCSDMSGRSDQSDIETHKNNNKQPQTHKTTKPTETTTTTTMPPASSSGSPYGDRAR